MKNLISILYITLLLVLTACYSNENSNNEEINGDTTGKYAVILVHGFNGWGRDEWKSPDNGKNWLHMGGYTDIQEELKALGNEVHTIAVGPFSSNWDRACELYAQLMNNPIVDYGKAHSELYCHNQTKTNHLYDKIKIKGGWNKEHKVHLICHSMGVSTARLLLHLLENGDPNEMALTINDSNYRENISPLFSGTEETKDLIKSITSIAGINNGTTLANSIKLNGDGLLKNVFNVDLNVLNTEKTALYILGFFTFLYGDTEYPFYDFKLEQFGITRDVKPDGKLETWQEYWNKVEKCSAMHTEDICVPDLEPEGMIPFNKKVKAEPNVYYFSYTTNQSKRMNSWYKYHIANEKMCPLMGLFTYLMGIYNADIHLPDSIINTIGIDRIDARWYPNDGVVNTIAQKYPMINSTDKCVRYNDSVNNLKPPLFTFDKEIDESSYKIKLDKCTSTETAIKPGIWHHMGQIDSDHWDIIGLGMEKYKKDGIMVEGPYYTDVNKKSEELIKFYSDLANFLHSLPKD